MNRKLILSILFLSFAIIISAQKVQDAEQYFNTGKCKEAYDIYHILLQKKPKDILLNYKAARCLFSMKQYDLAEQHFLLTKKIQKSYYYLACIYFQQYRFVESAEHFDLYKELAAKEITPEELEEVNTRILKTQMGLSMMQRVEKVAIVDSVKYHKKDFFRAYRLGSDVGIINYFDSVFPAGQSFTTAGASVFMTGRKDRMVFSVLDPHDKHYDLQISYRLIDGWTASTPLSKVLNTPADENFPFVLPDGITIYFASSGNNSLGGYDIFFSRHNSANEEYTTPKNIGMPFNSPSNDYMLAIDELAKVAWFATDRRQHPDTVVIYEFIPNETSNLIDTNDIIELTRYAKLTKYHMAEYTPQMLNTSPNIADNLPDTIEINFVVNDTLTYTTIDQFQSEEARDLYLKFIEVDKQLSTYTRLLKNKRREYMFLKREKEQKRIYLEILKIEENVFTHTDLLKEYLHKTRRSEINALNQVSR